MNLERIVAEVVALNDARQLAGRTRLQKTIYLLDQLGLESGAEFIYHHYGPFSSDVVSAWEMSELIYDFKTEDRSGNYGRYTVFRSQVPPSTQVGALPAEDVRRYLQRLAAASDIVLELAATVVFLEREGYGDPYDEVTIRKPLKATSQRLASARQLISELGLQLA